MKISLREYIELPTDQLKKLISAMDSNDVAVDDYVDSETGEIVLQRGDKARHSYLHPQYHVDAEEKRKNKNISFIDAVKKYASNWTNFTNEMPDIAPEAAAHDAAEGFFDEYPQWEDWAIDEDMTREDMLSAVMDYVYEAMIS